MSQSVFPQQDNDGSGNFKQPQTAAAANVFQQQDDPVFKGATMVAHQPFSVGAGPGLGPAPSMFGGMSHASPMPAMPGAMPMQKGGYPQEARGGLPEMQAKPTITVVPRQVSTDPAPPIHDSDVNWMRSMGTTATPDETVDQFLTACSELRILDVEATGFKLEGRFFSEQHKMAEFYVGVYTHTEKNTTILEINSSQGPVFQKFLTTILGRMQGLPNFETSVNTNESYDWSPLPLPILDIDDEAPSSPDVGGLDAPPMLPFGYPAEISLSLGFSVGDDGDADTQKRLYLEDLIESLETGYAREIADAAPNLACESEDADAVRVLRTVDNVVDRLLILISERLDACLVRSCVIALTNILSNEEFVVTTVDKEQVRSKLEEVSNKWATRQPAFVENEFIPKSAAIQQEINKAMMHLV